MTEIKNERSKQRQTVLKGPQNKHVKVDVTTAENKSM